MQTRGAAIIKARKLSSAMSAAKAICDHMRTWWFGTDGDFVSMGVWSDGSYGIPAGIVYSYPLEIKAGGTYSIVQNLPISGFSKEKMDLSAKELMEEKEVASSFLSS